MRCGLHTQHPAGGTSGRPGARGYTHGSSVSARSSPTPIAAGSGSHRARTPPEGGRSFLCLLRPRGPEQRPRRGGTATELGPQTAAGRLQLKKKERKKSAGFYHLEPAHIWLQSRGVLIWNGSDEGSKPPALFLGGAPVRACSQAGRWAKSGGGRACAALRSSPPASLDPAAAGLNLRTSDSPWRPEWHCAAGPTSAALRGHRAGEGRYCASSGATRDRVENHLRP